MSPKTLCAMNLLRFNRIVTRAKCGRSLRSSLISYTLTPRRPPFPLPLSREPTRRLVCQGRWHIRSHAVVATTPTHFFWSTARPRPATAAADTDEGLCHMQACVEDEVCPLGGYFPFGGLLRVVSCSSLQLGRIDIVRV